MNSMRSTLIVLGLLAIVCVGFVSAFDPDKKSNRTALAATGPSTTSQKRAAPEVAKVAVQVTGRSPKVSSKDKHASLQLGDSATLIRLTRDLDAAAGEHGKYMLVKKKPKHKKIKMEVYEPKMKYKKIKMKIPVKKMKKKKVKGYLVKKEKHGYEE